ncbi:MAG TPA: sporulation protein YtfJ [Ruminococcaceae bacterium]|nr:sporulation protein YtfJ [Oscillospiraceae bacterium]
MNGEHPINSLLENSLKNIKNLVDVDTIIGKPITSPEGITIIPVSKVSFGFASGGSDFPSKQPKDLFGGGSGGGVTISPIAFLVINNGEVKLLQLQTANNTADKAINMIPDVMDKISALFAKGRETEKSEKEKP